MLEHNLQAKFLTWHHSEEATGNIQMPTVFSFHSGWQHIETSEAPIPESDC